MYTHVQTIQAPHAGGQEEDKLTEKTSKYFKKICFMVKYKPKPAWYAVVAKVWTKQANTP